MSSKQTLRLVPVEEIGVQLFKMLLDGSLADHLWWEAIQKSAGCHHIGCPFAYVERTGNPYNGYDWDAWCEGYVSDRAASHAYESYSDYGAHECPIYRKWKAGEIDGSAIPVSRRET